jgi:endonuclease YncB( thermonuclease family)
MFPRNTCFAQTNRLLTFAVAVSWAVVGVAAEPFTATVVKVKDGDSLVVLRDNKQIDIRLEGIDCPELHQAYGQKAKQATSQLAAGKTVTVQSTGTDKYGRTLANIILPDGRSLSQELVRQGCAWWFKKYSKDQALAKMEVEARQKKIGLWADPNPTAPWDWRKAQKDKGKPAVGELVPNGVAVVGLLPDPVGRDEGHEAVEIGNSTDQPIDLAGWKLRDRAGNEYRLAGTVVAKRRLRIVMTTATMSLNNDGDTVMLIDPAGVLRSRVEYGKDQVRVGKWVEFNSK